MNSEASLAISIGPPLDYSFQELKSIQDLATHEPSSGRVKARPPAIKETAALALTEGVATTAPTSRPVEHHPAVLKLKLITNAIRLSYNAITSVDSLGKEASLVVDDLANIAWVDLSHNQIESVGEALKAFPNLKVLYLHANRVPKLAPILDDLVGSCPQLTKLTLFGNPAEDRKSYRAAIIRAFPSLQSLDFVRVTPRDRDLVEVWARSSLRPRNQH